MSADLVERKLAGFEELYQMRARNAENVGSRLSSQFLHFRNQRNDLSFLHGGCDPDEQLIYRARQFEPMASFIHQRWRFCFTPKQCDQMADRLGVMWRKLGRIKPGRQARLQERCCHKRIKRNNRTKRNGYFAFEAGLTVPLEGTGTVERYRTMDSASQPTVSQRLILPNP